MLKHPQFNGYYILLWAAGNAVFHNLKDADEYQAKSLPGYNYSSMAFSALVYRNICPGYEGRK